MRVTRRQLERIIQSTLKEARYLSEGPDEDCDQEDIKKKKYMLDTKITSIYNKLFTLAGKDVKKIESFLDNAQNFSSSSVIGRFINKIVSDDTSIGSAGGKLTTTSTSTKDGMSYSDSKTKMIPKKKEMNEESGNTMQAAGLAAKIVAHKEELGKMAEDVYKTLSDLVQSMGPDSGCKWGGTSTDSDIYKEEEYEFNQAIDRSQSIPDEIKGSVKSLVSQFQVTSY